MAFCRNCGKEVNDGAKFCAGCGTPTGVAAGGQSPVAYQQVKSSGVTPPPTVDDFDDIEKKSPNYTIVIIAAVAVCVAAIIGIVVMKSGTVADEETSSAAASNTDSVQGDIPAPTQQNNTSSAQNIIKGLPGEWVFENRYEDDDCGRCEFKTNALERKVFTFYKDGKVYLVESSKGQSSPYLKQDYEFRSYGTYNCKGDTIMMFINRFAAVRQIFSRLEGNVWKDQLGPTYDNTVEDGSQDRFVTYEDLQEDFIQVKKF